MALEAISGSIGPYISQFTGFVSKNWTACKNTSVEYGTKIWNSETVQKIVEYVKPLINKLDQYYPDSLRFEFSKGTAVATLLTSVTALALLSYFFGSGNAGRTAR